MKKICNKCSLPKELTDFYKERSRADGLRPICKSCARKLSTAWYANNPEKVKVKLTRAKMSRKENPSKYRAYKASVNRRYDPKKNRAKYLRETYKLSVGDVESMLQRQHNTCFACHESLVGKKICVDHDHSCCSGSKSCGGCVRSLLCDRCNRVLGSAQDAVHILEKCILYLKLWNKLTKMK